MVQLGTLENVDLRTVWATEGSHFTPWLCELPNLALLSRAVGIQLEFEAREQWVGRFCADIIARNTANNERVLIENQIERTDHSHLGQILTYAAGLKPTTVIWVARDFTEEHLAAIDWLNEITASGYAFFGVKIELLRIGESLCAPQFTVVAKPNNYARQVQETAETAELSETRKTQLEFWQKFCEHLTLAGSLLRCGNPRPQHWMGFSSGVPQCGLSAVATYWDSETGTRNAEIRVEVYFDGKDARATFDRLLADREAIESEAGAALLWWQADEGKRHKIAIRQSVDLDDRSCWNEYFEWLRERLEMMQRVVARRAAKEQV